MQVVRQDVDLRRQDRDLHLRGACVGSCAEFGWGGVGVVDAGGAGREGGVGRMTPEDGDAALDVVAG